MLKKGMVRNDHQVQTVAGGPWPGEPGEGGFIWSTAGVILTNRCSITRELKGHLAPALANIPAA